MKNISTMSSRIYMRNDTLDNYLDADPLLLNGEIALVHVNGYIKIKIGDGEHHFSDLEYVVDPELINVILNNLESVEQKVYYDLDELQNNVNYLSEEINDLKTKFITLFVFFMISIGGILTAITMIHM